MTAWYSATAGGRLALWLAVLGLAGSGHLRLGRLAGGASRLWRADAAPFGTSCWSRLLVSPSPWSRCWRCGPAVLARPAARGRRFAAAHAAGAGCSVVHHHADVDRDHHPVAAGHRSSSSMSAVQAWFEAARHRSASAPWGAAREEEIQREIGRARVAHHLQESGIDGLGRQRGDDQCWRQAALCGGHHRGDRGRRQRHDAGPPGSPST